jgi:deazaflavin-dependent oxidoreductase (nitroreductase family)
MSAYSPEQVKMMRAMFDILNKFMLAMFRLGLGSWINIWPKVIGQIMVITHIGRKSGLKRYTPVNFARIEDEIYCTAGLGQIAYWYQNMVANPNIEVWLPNAWWAGTAVDISESDQRLDIMRQVLKGSGFASFAAGINPYSISDEELEKITQNYRLFHLKRSEARTGPGGPGMLSWIWPILTSALLLVIFLPNGKKK